MTQCKHENSISVYDGSCHVILGQWYCTDCKIIYKEPCKHEWKTIQGIHSSGLECSKCGEIEFD